MVVSAMRDVSAVVQNSNEQSDGREDANANRERTARLRRMQCLLYRDESFAAE